jgi:inosine-uridine nucleoside N-ribohydrolase
MAEVWFRHADRITFHDPLAAALLFDPGICSYATGTARPVSEEGPFAGLTRWQEGGTEPRPHTVASAVDAARFFAHYFSVTGG